MALSITETTTAASSITQTTAMTGGTVTALNGKTDAVRGVAWAISPAAPLTGTLVPGPGTGLGDYTVNLTGLPVHTTIKYAAYTTDSLGTTTVDAAPLSLTTLAAVAPTVTTTAVSAIGFHTATGGGNVTDNGGSNVTAKGICWATTANPTVAGSHTSDGTGTGIFTSSIAGLNPDVLYHVRAYATNAIGTSYGNDLTFMSAAEVPILTSLPTFTFGLTTATLRATITNNEGFAITESGQYWGTTNNPVGAGTKVVGTLVQSGYFETLVTELPAGTKIYTCAYATNAQGTGYGAVLNFTTVAAVKPTIITTLPSSPIFNVVLAGGTNVSDGGATLTETGIAWNTTPNPVIGDNKSVNSGDNYQPFVVGFGSTASTKYYIRAYATNSVGTGYGSQFIIDSNILDMKPERIEKVSITKVVPFSINVPFDNTLTIAQTQISQATVFTPNLNGALAGNKTLYRVIGDGVTTPTFDSAWFKPMSTTAAYDPTLNVTNLIEFLFDGLEYWYNIISGAFPS